MRGRLTLPLALTTLCVVAVAWVPAVRAAGDDADAAIRRGVDLRRQGKDQEALEEFRKSYAVANTPRALAQIGLAEQALGRWVDAESDLDQAMANKADPWIRKNATVLTGALEIIRRHLGSLDVIGPAGAELRVDGRSVGTLPLARPARVPIGSLTVDLRKEGFFAATRPVSIAAGELTRESIDLQPRAAAPLPPPTTPPPSGGLGSSGARAPEPLGAASDGTAGGAPLRGFPVQSSDGPGGGGGGGGWQRTLAWSTAIAALVGAGAGVGALLIRSGKITDANNVPCNISGGMVNPPNAADGPHCVDLAKAGDRARVAEVISFSAAGALAITSAILFATTTSSRSPSPSPVFLTTGLRCAPTLAATGVACQLSF